MVATFLTRVQTLIYIVIVYCQTWFSMGQVVHRRKIIHQLMLMV